MADIELVIKIPEKTTNKIKDNVMFAGTIPSEILWDVSNAISNGKPLPEGHGRLIDADLISKQYGLDNATKYGNKNAKQQAESYSTMMMYEIADMIDDAPTVIKADGGVE